MLENLAEFFNNWLEEYEKHQFHMIEGPCKLYPFPAMHKEANVLDLG
ncbi:MAG: hypothetical protein K2N64_04255 [Anaeroplasmataceae bacterium]|nr:hypothetical protein [Anaeroplasmataceae bacterium]